MLRHITAACLIALLPGLAHAAETRGGTLAGSSLDLDVSCVRAVAILPDATLQGRVAYAADAETAAELDHLTAAEDGAARLTTRDGLGCRTGDGVTVTGNGGSVTVTGGNVVVGGGSVTVSNSGAITYSNGGVVIDNGRVVGGRAITPADLPKATLRLSVRVPVGFPIRLALSGSVEGTVGEVRGPLKTRLTGAPKLRVAAAGPLDLDLSGSSSLTVGESGPIKADLSGASTVIIDRVVGDVAVEVSGNGRVALAGGRIDDLEAEVSGAGEVIVDVPVRDADLEVSGAGRIRLAKATGTVRRDVSGAGRITVDER